VRVGAKASGLAGAMARSGTFLVPVQWQEPRGVESPAKSKRQYEGPSSFDLHAAR